MNSPVVWITGAGRGIGRATAMEFASIGARVVLSGRTKRPLERVAAAIRRTGGDAIVVVCDVASESSVRRAASTIEKRLGPVNILVNNAGIAPWKAFLKTTVDEFDETIATNL